MRMNKYSYLDPTSPAYFEDFHRPRTLLCFSIRQFLHLLTIIDIVFSSIGLCCGLTYLIIDQLSQMKLFQSNEFLQNLRHVPIGIFSDNRIVSRPFWTINVISATLPVILYSHILLNSLSLFCSINMLSAIKSYKLYGALIYFTHEAAYFVHSTSIFARWTVDPEKERKTIELIYGKGDFGFFTANWNIFCWGIAELFWKIFTLTMIFRSIQFLRDYHLQKNLNSKTDNQSSTGVLVSHVLPNKQFLV